MSRADTGLKQAHHEACHFLNLRTKEREAKQGLGRKIGRGEGQVQASGDKLDDKLTRLKSWVYHVIIG